MIICKKITNVIRSKGWDKNSSLRYKEEGLGE